KIIRQALRGLPLGDVTTGRPKRLKPPVGEVYARTEGARGDIGFYLVSDGTDTPARCKVRAPSFCTISCLPEVGPGAMIADAVALVGSLDIVLGEIDR
ncbi:MAG: NADH-quinone oxidoreductase subunit D, partial [Deltaproteobacteria bacterium]|nr:NADH-quinone oxidoreductase subunit D [Deltaproteobacteria bacterium]